MQLFTINNTMEQQDSALKHYVYSNLVVLTSAILQTVYSVTRLEIGMF